MGHTEARVTGSLAGHNAVRLACGKDLVELPRSLAIGDAIAYVGSNYKQPPACARNTLFPGSVYFERMQKLGLYTTDKEKIAARVAAAGLAGIYNRRIV